jgi:monomeric sarcosine oxidase
MSARVYDVIVLGGGTMGTAAAWELGKRGVRALVLERFQHVHSFGAHGGKTRIIRHAYAEGADYVPLVLRADQLWQELEAESGERVLIRSGGLELAAPGHGHARAARASANAHAIPYEWLTAAEANRRWPAFSIPADWEVLFSPGAGFLLTEPALSAMAAAARRRGVVINEHEAAEAWGADASGAWVRSARDTYLADRLIVTAGAWAGPLLADLGLPLTIQRKVLWWIAVADPDPFAPERFPIFITDSPFGEIYGFPVFGHPGLKIANHAGGEPTTADTVDRTVRDEEKADVVALARLLFPSVGERVLESAVCLYARTPDTDFILDRHPEWPNVVVGAGFSGHGFKFATAVGEHLVELALDSTAPPFPRLALDRFGAVAAG